MSLGTVVRSARMQAEMSQQDLARAMFLKGYTFDSSMISLIETGKVQLPSKEILHGLAEVLDVTVSQLLHAAGYIPDEELPGMLNGEMGQVWTKLPAAEREMVLRIARLYVEALEGRIR